MPKKADHPFQFVTQVNLVSITGKKASNLKELLNYLKEAPPSVVYHHTHLFLKQHQYLSPEPPNDFAWWVTHILQEKKLGEQLLAIDTIRFNTLRSLADKLIQVIENHVARSTTLRTVPEGEEFYFLKTQSFILPTQYQATDLEEFAACIEKISIHSLYHHMFEARIRLEKGANDFSEWLAKELGEVELAKIIARFDPYTHTLEDLKKKIVGVVQKRLNVLTKEPALAS